MKYTLSHSDVGSSVEFKLTSEVISQTLSEISANVRKWSVDLEDAAIKKALISRGWTPPTDNYEEDNCV